MSNDAMGDDDRLYLVDGSSYIFRAFYGVQGLRDSEGFPTNAVYGFVQMILTLLQEADPEYLAVALDAFGSDEPTFRAEMYDEYKAHRDDTPEELKPQIPYIRKILEGLRVPILEQEGVEADDLIATATREARESDVDVTIISADKDLMQLLVDEHVLMHDTMRDETYTPEEVEERFGVSPEKQRYVMAMAGDSSDNIPGVPGIGPKTGGKLIRQFGDLDGVYENLDEVGGKKRPKNLRRHERDARMSLELVTLKDDCDIEFDLESLRLSPPDVRRLGELFDELEFRSLLDDLEEWLDERGWLEEEQLELSLGPASYASPEDDASEKTYRGVFTESRLEEVVEACEEADRFAVDLETTSIDSLEAEIVGVALAWEAHEAVYIPFGHSREGASRQLDRETVLEALRPLLESETSPKVLQHWKYEWSVFQNAGIDLDGVEFDTMLMSYLLNPGRNSHALDALVREYLEYETIKYGDVAGEGDEEVSFDEVPVAEAVPYAAEDADVTLLLCEEMRPEFEEAGLRELHDDIEVPISRILGIMERTGIRVDREVLAELSEEFGEELRELEDEIDEHAGREVNPNSPKQLREVLFDDLGLPVKKRTKTGPSTARSVLEQLSDLHPLPDLILEYRSFSKLKGTYLDALPDLIREDGRIHTSFNQAATSTGRLSSSEPNLQNIPIRTERGRRIRRAFVAEPGWELVAADYSQIELRILAHLSGDPLLVEAYREGRDIHNLTAAQIFEVELDEVTSEQRELGKTINYGVLYGMGSRRLARDFEISQSEASDYIDGYFERYEVVDEFFDGLVEEAHEKGYAETMYGRRRHLPGLDGHGGQRAYAERAAVNTPIQGSAADIIKVAMIEMQRRIEQEELPLEMLLQVHDELVFEAKSEFVEEAIERIRECMEGVVELDVPLLVDIESGESWLEAK